MTRSIGCFLNTSIFLGGLFRPFHSRVMPILSKQWFAVLAEQQEFIGPTVLAVVGDYLVNFRFPFDVRFVHFGGIEAIWCPAVKSRGEHLIVIGISWPKLKNEQGINSRVSIGFMAR
ncbi:MAG: hypothetical protein C5B58_05705 [Acidobacteria bacterium]|nr:MAG: hypothetical protein C5B58_05705 [Acidobacteriota bacterium]